MSQSSRTRPVLKFLGAAQTVTGSRFMLESGGARILIDCGLFQGLKELRLRNWEKFPIDPKTIDAVVLTHAHLDHSGYLPLLRRDGFRGPIFAPARTVDLCRIVLPDSGRLQEEEARYANEAGYSKHSPAKPLYTEDDAFTCMDSFEAVPFDSPVKIHRACEVTFRPAGHILGSATVRIELASTDRAIVFSGDLGRPNHPLLRPPAPIGDADVVLIESTYGDRVHDDADSLRRFEDALIRAAARRGVIIIPSFAVDRTEIVLFHLRRMMASGRLGAIPIYVDSPMALAALRQYKHAIAAADPEVREDVAKHPELIEPPNLTEIRTVAESIALNHQSGPMIIISASGMVTGGRVLHHLAHRLDEKNNTVILVGYQAQGTRGRSLLEGASNVKMLGRYVPVRAEIVDVPAFSVHADRRELIEWLAGAPHRPETTYLVHGEAPAAFAMRDAVASELHHNAVVPHQFEQVRI
ncbi:MAG TPA: MBL fold metallo-hydrolase [Candidatus Binataceae bacterium]|nr:MBL fold metallo-hydrolase [Candidatus Binataceae bacterium]